MDHIGPDNSECGAPGSPGDAYLICRSNARLCALPLASVAETMRSLPLEPLAAMPAFVLGVSVIRGVPVPVVDAARLLGASGSAAPQRVVTLKIGARRVGFAVDGVVGVRTIPPAALEDVPSLLRETENDVVSAISTLDAKLLLVLQGARMVPDALWETLMDAAPA